MGIVHNKTVRARRGLWLYVLYALGFSRHGLDDLMMARSSSSSSSMFFLFGLWRLEPLACLFKRCRLSLHGAVLYAKRGALLDDDDDDDDDGDDSSKQVIGYQDGGIESEQLPVGVAWPV